ncbi:MAG: hypothetical protein GX811_08905 [Lentisphaerae bacterium]|nr:hypothetical protein [Lentisphaerota bacterium]
MADKAENIVENEFFTEHKRLVARVKTAFYEEYLQQWNVMLQGMGHQDKSDSVWLMFSSNYMFSMGGVFWALDPVHPGHLAEEFKGKATIDPLKQLDFVIVSHEHPDHADFELVGKLIEAGVPVYAPQALCERSLKNATPALPDVPIIYDDIKITPFAGWHFEVPPTGKEALGFLIEKNGKKMLFPGDTRFYVQDALKPFAPVDFLFAHFWLGRTLIKPPDPTAVEEFCDFMLSSQPANMVCTHMYEFIFHPVTDVWTDFHVGLVKECLKARKSKTQITVPKFGERILL